MFVISGNPQVGPVFDSSNPSLSQNACTHYVYIRPAIPSAINEAILSKVQLSLVALVRSVMLANPDAEIYDGRRSRVPAQSRF